ncbi:hypothetical protein [Mycobacterium sp. OTB74]|uniref:hypothetical protein n=1 Tax=Mycobacterium sp. OTB74 TaxID=1853452 RepID=UPI0024752CD4|nr:hypothetical protein [Mycobacterium sp. OTB74]MDH6242862.1 hypothetical protein [Mycobacterium sp. OTB74]
MTDQNLARTTIVPTVIAYGLAFFGLLTGFIALSSDRLYVGSIAIIAAVVAATVGSVWLLNRLVHNQHLMQRRMGNPRL